MKKKILCMTLVVFVGMLSGCGTEDKEIQQGDNTTLENKVLENTVPENKETYDSSDGLPPVEPEMKQFYKEAEELFKDIVFLRLDCDDQQSKIEATDDEDVQVLYYKVTDERFPTMENLKALSENLNNKNSTLGMLMNDKALYKHLDDAVASLDTLLTDIQRNPKRYVTIKVF